MPSLFGTNVRSAGALRRILFVEADTLAFGERVETSLDAAAVEEIFLPGRVSNEPESLVACDTLDCAARHRSSCFPIILPSHAYLLHTAVNRTKSPGRT